MRLSQTIVPAAIIAILCFYLSYVLSRKIECDGKSGVLVVGVPTFECVAPVLLQDSSDE